LENGIFKNESYIKVLKTIEKGVFYLLSNKKISLLLLSAGIAGAIFMNGTVADAHGYVEAPPSRGYQGVLDRSTIGYEAAFRHYGAVINNPQSLEAPKGFPQGGPADGRIASANGGLGQIGDFVLDNQTAVRWTKQEVETGPLNLTWRYTAPHSTAKWHYYMTKPGWNPNEPLARKNLEEIAVIDHDNSSSSNNMTHNITIPENRLGYHVILAVWDVADTPNAFYNVIDVNVSPDNNIPTPPTVPVGLSASSVTATTVSLNWRAQSDAVAYNVYRDGKLIDQTTSPGYTDRNLTPETAYRYQIEAVGRTGLVSEKSTAVHVTTKEESAVENPTAPANLHSMGETTNSSDLMWAKSEHSQGIKEYQIFRNNQLVATTVNTRYVDRGLTQDTTYTYFVKAVSNTGEVSESSNVLTVKTKKAETTPGDYREWKVGTFTAPELYTAGEMVSYQGNNFRALQTHFNYGDTNWSPNAAPALFTPVK
jgi:predicted carbohydrate-binding protein with CBM5 and CBM33 domain